VFDAHHRRHQATDAMLYALATRHIRFNGFIKPAAIFDPHEGAVW
jgi:hypothetical protein